MAEAFSALDTFSAICNDGDMSTAAHTAADEAAAAVFADASVEDVKTAYVTTFTQADRFGDDAPQIRVWAVKALAAKIGAKATGEFVVSCGPEAIADYLTAVACCPCGRLDRAPCTRVGGDGECATTAPLRFVWTVSLGVEADSLTDAEKVLSALFADDGDWTEVAEHVAIYPCDGPPDDVVDLDDGPVCTCPPELVARGGFQSSCPACGNGGYHHDTTTP